MLLGAVIICCTIVANAEPSLNSYSLTGDSSNGYDYSNAVASNGYLGSKDGYYLNGGGFYGAGVGTHHELSDHAGHSSSINVDNGQGNVRGSDIGSSYNGYSANDHGGAAYAVGYSNTHENSASETHHAPIRAASLSFTPFRGYIGDNNDGDSTFSAYSSDSTHKDSDFGQYVTSGSSKRMPGYSRPTRVSDNYPESPADQDGVHHGSSGSSYSESDHIYAPYSPGGLTGGYYPLGKQKNDPSNLKGVNRHSGVHSVPPEIRYARGSAGHVSHNRDTPSFIVSGGSGRPEPGGRFSKTHGTSYIAEKPRKYGYKHLSRYAPNGGAAYVSRERDSYTPYGKGGRKVIIIKDSSPSYIREPLHAASDDGYGSKSGFANGHSTTPNFDGYTGSGSYDDGPTVLRRYRTSSSPVFLQKSTYP